MKISVDQPRQDVHLIVLDGRLDVAGTQMAEVEFKAMVATSHNARVDMAKVPFIASQGIRMLVAGAQARTKGGGKMLMMNPDDMTRKILKTTGIDQLVAVCNGLDKALALI